MTTPTIFPEVDLRYCGPYGYRNYQNSKTYIIRLPVEVLQEIFAYICDAEVPRPPVLVLSQVCKSWGSVCLGYPALWSTIYITAFSRNFIHPKVQLSRAKTSRLSIILATPLPSPFDLVSYLEPRHEQITRVVFHPRVFTPEVLSLFAGCGVLPKLSHLTFHDIGTNPPSNWFGDLIPRRIQAPNLNSLTIYGSASYQWFSLQHILHIDWQRITTLRASALSSWALMHMFSSLETLVWDVWTVGEQHTVGELVVTDWRVVCPCLKNLEVRAAFSNEGLIILEAIIMTRAIKKTVKTIESLTLRSKPSISIRPSVALIAFKELEKIKEMTALGLNLRIE